MRAPELRGSVRRLGAARSLLVLAFVGLAARGIHLTLIDPRGSERGIEQLRTTIALAPERGLILDRNGSELALTVKAPSLFAVPSKVADPTATARTLAKELGADARRIEAQLRRRGHFAYLARWVTPEQAERVRALALPGIEVMHEPRRVYPYRELAAHAVGFSNIDGEGIRGVEEQENGFLRGQARKIPVERDAHGRLMIGTAPDPDATAGGDLMLTLDATLQADAERALEAAIASTQSRAGLVVSLDPRSGEILALAERPTFDPNRFRDLHFPETRSRAFLDAFEPGSTFKTFVISAALEAGAVHLEDRFDCENGRFPVPGKVIRDSHPHGVLTVAEVLQVSSNIGAAKIGYRIGAPRLHAALRRFGFGRATGSGFPAESTGLLRHWKKWRPVDHANASFGQGVSVTPIQMAAAIAAIANGGVWTTPHLVAERRARGETVFTPAAPSELRRVLRPETARRMLETLEGVVSTQAGTGKRAHLSGIRVGGKTGTAQKLDPVTHRYSDNRYIAWFTGIAPIEDPKLVVVVALDEPKGIAHTGGMVAAPLFAAVAGPQLARLGVTGSSNDTLLALSTPPPAVSAAAAPDEARSIDAALLDAEGATLVLIGEDGRTLVPDLSGLTVTQVRAALARGGLDLDVEGDGRAVAQEPEPGTILAAGTKRVRVRFAPGA